MSTEHIGRISDGELQHRHEGVPPDYYHAGVKNNFFQRAWHERRIPIVTQLLANRGGRLLDLGCHGGYLTEVIQRASGAMVTGMDISPDAIRYAQQRLPDATFLVGDLQAGLPFSDGAFRTITAFDVLEHIPRLDRVLAEAWRVLEPSGHLVVGVPRDTWLFRLTWKLWTTARGSVWQDVHVHEFTAQALHAIARQQGFEPIEERISHWGMYLVMVFRKPV